MTPEAERLGSLFQDEKMLLVLELLTLDPTITQRRMAQKAGVSLGLINVIMKRLVDTGSIKMQQLTGRKVRYLLTPKGLSEQTQRAYIYFTRTARSFFRHQVRCDRLIHNLLLSGYRDFAVLGDNEVASMVDLSLRKSSLPVRQRIVGGPNECRLGEVLLDCRFHGGSGPLGSRVLAKILRASSQGGAVHPPVVRLTEALIDHELTPEQDLKANKRKKEGI